MSETRIQDFPTAKPYDYGEAVLTSVSLEGRSITQKRARRLCVHCVMNKN